MPKKDNLFLLIKNLSRSEKRYFKLFSNNDNRHNNYLKLFAAIYKQEFYDEDKIRRKFKGEKFLDQLHVTKNYLGELIYKSNRNYHGNLSKSVKVRNYLTNVEIMFNKELYVHCSEELIKAEKISLKYELFSYLMEIYDWQRKLEQHINPHNYLLFKQILDNQSFILNKLQNQNKYLHLIVDISGNIADGKSEEVKNEQMLQDERNAISLESKVMHYNARYFRSIQKDDARRGVQDLLKLIKYFDNNPFWVESRPGTYIATLNNLITYYIFSEKSNKAVELINKAKQVYGTIRPKSENRSLLKQIMRTYNIELEIYRDQQLYLEDPGYIDSTEAFVVKYRFKMPKEYLILFWFQLANIRFMQNDFANALKWVNEIIQTNFRDIRKDIQMQARFLNLLVHLEQKNMFVLRYFVDSTRRFVKKRKEMELFEKILLGFFSKMGRIPESEYQDGYSEVYEKLFPDNEAAIISSNQLDYVDYRAWLRKKLGLS